MADEDGSWCWCCGILILLAIIGEFGEEIIGFILVIIGLSIPVILIYYGIKYYNNKEADKVYQETDKSYPPNHPLSSFTTKSDEIPQYDEILQYESIDEEEIQLYTLLIEVKDGNGEPIENATLKVESDDGFFDEKISDIDGKVIYPRLQNEKYTINVTADGFVEVDKSVNLNQKTTIEIEMEEYAKLELSVLDEALNVPIEDATVEVEDKEYTTDEKGIVHIQNILKGKDVTIHISKDLYHDHELEYSIQESTNQVTVSLKPNIVLKDTYIDIRKELEASMNATFGKLSKSIDLYIPNYYNEFIISSANLLESIAINPVYMQVSGFDEKIDNLYNIQKKICNRFDDTLTDAGLLTDLNNITVQDDGKQPVINITLNSYRSFIESYLNHPDDFVDQYKDDIAGDLSKVDQQITEHFRTHAMSPIIGMWEISKSLVESNSADITENAASLLFGKILLDTTDNMFKINEIIERLKLNY